jgi:hypothetical protein
VKSSRSRRAVRSPRFRPASARLLLLCTSQRLSSGWQSPSWLATCPPVARPGWIPWKPCGTSDVAFRQAGAVLATTATHHCDRIDIEQHRGGAGLVRRLRVEDGGVPEFADDARPREAGNETPRGAFDPCFVSRATNTSGHSDEVQHAPAGRGSLDPKSSASSAHHWTELSYSNPM